VAEVAEVAEVDYPRRFGGLARLYGAEGLVRLAAAHVCVIGIGGVGSWAAEALARSAVGRLTLIDPDHVAESNLNRQIHALEDTLGQAKVAAMAARIAAIHPGCRVTAQEVLLEPGNVADWVPADADYVLDAIDSVPAKLALVRLCQGRGQRLICVGGAGGKLDPTQLKIDDLARASQDPLLAKLRSQLRRQHGYPGGGRKMGVECVYSSEALRRPPAPSCASSPSEGLHGLNCAGYGSVMTVTAAFGLFAAGRVLNRLAAG